MSSVINTMTTKREKLFLEENQKFCKIDMGNELSVSDAIRNKDC